MQSLHSHCSFHGAACSESRQAMAHPALLPNHSPLRVRLHRGHQVHIRLDRHHQGDCRFWSGLAPGRRWQLSLRPDLSQAGAQPGAARGPDTCSSGSPRCCSSGLRPSCRPIKLQHRPRLKQTRRSRPCCAFRASSRPKCWPPNARRISSTTRQRRHAEPWWAGSTQGAAGQRHGSGRRTILQMAPGSVSRCGYLRPAM